MNLFKKLFGGSKPARKGAGPATDTAPAGGDRSGMITVFDDYGREMQITRKDWRNSVLLPGLKKARNDPDGLAQLITGALQDGFFAEVEAAAKQLHEIDPTPARGAVLLSIIHLQTGRPALAEKILVDHVRAHGEDGTVLTNLAKAQYALDRENDGLVMLWHALELDPNQDNGLAWYLAIHEEQDGRDGHLRALYRLAALPGSWRARLWLARHALEHGRVDDAMEHYRASLNQTSDPTPSDLLMQLSGDLGNQGHLPQILELALPRFRPDVHGLTVGNNLLKTAIDLGQLDLARSLLQDLQKQQRPDWREQLTFWEQELHNARLDTEPAKKPEELRVSLLTLVGPVWLPSEGPLAGLFPTPPPDASVITFLGSSATLPSIEDPYKAKPADSIGRATRAFPLALAEHFRFHSDCDARTLVPWIDQGGFLLAGKPSEDAVACQHARGGDHPADYAVVTHLDGKSDIWKVSARVLRTIDAKLLSEDTVEFPKDQPGKALPRLQSFVARILGDEDAASPRTQPASYQPPADPAQLDHLLLRLEQCLAVRCSTLPGAADSISNAAEIIDGMIQLCLDHPQSVSCRCLLVHTLVRLAETQADFAKSFLPKLEQLATAHPLPHPADAAIHEAIAGM